MTNSNLGIYFLTKAKTANMCPSNEGIHSRLPRVLKKHIRDAGAMPHLHKPVQERSEQPGTEGGARPAGD